MHPSLEKHPSGPPFVERPLVVSIVSHGHGALVQRLLEQIALYSGPVVARVVLTLNVPQNEPAATSAGWPFQLDVRSNRKPLGFSQNHNRALDGATERFVCILNPDVALCDADPFAPLVSAAMLTGVGCAYPVQIDENGRPQDNERALPTPQALFERRILGHRETVIDWVNAACMVLPAEVWQKLGGFDTRYFMYCEDVDLCLRARLLGLRLARADACVVHSGQRASRRQWRALRWHLTSLLRLWRSKTYRDARRLLQPDTPCPGSIGTP